MLEKRAWAKKHADHLRRALMLEPRGHADMYGAVLTEPVSPGSHAGVLFMHNEGWSTMCGHGIIAVTTIALERGLLMPGGDGTIDRLRHAGWPGRALAGRRRPALVQTGPRRRELTFANVPSFVLVRRAAGGSAPGRFASTSRLAAPSMPLSTARRSAFLSTPPTCPSCGVPGWRSQRDRRVRHNRRIRSSGS